MINILKRNFFPNIFSGVAQFKNNLYQTVKFLGSYTPFYSSFDGDIYNENLIRACIDKIATHTAKLSPKVKLPQGVLPDKRIVMLEYLLKRQPNEYMSAFDFMYKFVSMLYTSNNVFIYCRTDKSGICTGFYPIDFSQVEILECESLPGELFARFRFRNNSFSVVIPYSELVHLRRHFNKHDIYGSEQNTLLRPILSVLGVIRDGMINAVKASGQLRGYIKVTGNLNDEDVKKRKDWFVDNFMSLGGSGVGATDSKAEFVPLKVEPVQINASQRKITYDEVRTNFGVSEAILNGDYTEEQFSAFYNNIIEPLAMQLSQAFTNKLFTKQEILGGREVVYSADKLTFASYQTKTNMINILRGIGILSANDCRRVLEMSDIDGKWANEHIVSLNYVTAPKANQYQGVDDGNDEGVANE